MLYLFKATSRIARSGRQLFPVFWFSPLPLFLCFVVLLAPVSGARADSLSLTASTQVASAGYYQLAWPWPSAPSGVVYELQERHDDSHAQSDFVTIYQGTDTASVISGKPNGRYQYRLLATTAGSNVVATSGVVTVEVAHHSLTQAFIVLAIGFAIFVAILIAIFRGEGRNIQ